MVAARNRFLAFDFMVVTEVDMFTFVWRHFTRYIYDKSVFVDRVCQTN